MTNVKQVVALTVFLLSAVAYSADFNVRDFGALLSRRVCEEGFVLLKNENAALPLAKGAKVAVFAPATRLTPTTTSVPRTVSFREGSGSR